MEKGKSDVTDKPRDANGMTDEERNALVDELYAKGREMIGQQWIDDLTTRVQTQIREDQVVVERAPASAPLLPRIPAWATFSDFEKLVIIHIAAGEVSKAKAAFVMALKALHDDHQEYQTPGALLMAFGIDPESFGDIL